MVILHNLGWYCDVTNVFIRQRQIQIVTWNNRNQNRGIIKFCYKEYFNFWTCYTCITWFGIVYAFHKLLRSLLRVNYPKTGYIVYPVQKFKNIPEIIKENIIWYYGFGLLHTFSLVLQPWMSAYIWKTDGVYMYVFGLPHLGPKKQ